MDDGQFFGLGVMRMRIDLVGFTVRCPTGVRDTNETRRIFVCHGLFQIGYFTFGFIDIELSTVVDKCDAGTIVTTIFQTM